MDIKLTRELEAALSEAARRTGMSPQDMALDVLRERFLGDSALLTPADEWEQNVLGAGSDCGVSLPHSTLSSEGLYD